MEYDASMSMELTTDSTRRQQQLFYAYLFARVVRNRRRQLGLTVKRAAELTGIAVSEWYGLEAGWVPPENKAIRTISETLQVRTTELVVAAFLSRSSQEALAQ